MFVSLEDFQRMPIATSRQYVATSYQDTIELWDPEKKIRTVHELDSSIVIKKVECYWQGGVALTTDGRVFFFTHSERSQYTGNEVITDIACGERDLLMTTKTGKFIKIGKRGHYLTTAPPPLKVAIGPAKIAYIANGKLYVGEKAIDHSELVQQVAVGGGHTIFVDDKGGLYGFGNNQHGQLGRGIIEYALDPVRLPFFGKIKKVAAGHEHTVILDDQGQTWITGANSRGQLGTEIVPIEGCRWGFTELRAGVVDICARGSVTMLDFANGDMESIGIRS